MDAKIMLIIVLIADCVKGQAEWSFSGKYGLGPDRWAENYTSCAGPRGLQSPINIPHETFYNESLTPFSFHGYDTLSTDELEIQNTGKRVEVGIKEGQRGQKAYFTGGGYTDRYNAVEIHFHWGINDTDCAGHALHGECYPLELHVVNLNEKYDDPAEAISVDGGVAVLAFLFKLSAEDNEVLKPFLDALVNVTYKGLKMDHFEKDFAHFMGSETARFYRYHGSMGYPPCLETISWTVFEPTSKHTVSSAQLSKLREIYQTEDGASPAYRLEFNHRALQEIRQIRVEMNFKGTDSVSAVTASFGMVIFSMISLLIL